MSHTSIWPPRSPPSPPTGEPSSAGSTRPGGPAEARGLASPSPAAGPPSTWPRRMPRCASAAGHGHTDAHAASEFPLGRELRPRRGHLPLGHHDRGGRAARRPARARGQRHHRDRRDRGHAPSPHWPPQSSSCCPRSTSSRSCRPASPPPPSPCCAPAWARTSRRAIADAEVVLAEDEDTALAGLRGRRADHLRGPRLDHRAGPRGRPEAARVGPVLDRVLPRHGVPPRPDQHRHRRPRDLGLRRGPRGTRRGRPRDGCALRAPRHRPDGRPRAPAPPLRGQGGAGRSGPGSTRGT